MSGLFNKEEYANGLRVNNAVFDEIGAEQTITTLTGVIEGVLEQKFYELNGQNLSRDFIPVIIGKNNYRPELFKYASAQVGSSFKSGIVSPGNGINRDAQTDIAISGKSLKNYCWRMKYEVTNEIAKQMARGLVPFDYVGELEKARLKTWQLGLQDIAFNGVNAESTGLLNNANVTVNTTLMPANLASMTIEQLNNFAGTAIATFFANSNSTETPNRLALSTADYMALGTAVNPEYPIKNKKEYLLDAFKSATGREDFKIVHSVYAENAGVAGATRSILYKHDPEVLAMYVMPYKPYPLFPVNALDMVSDAEGQFTGVEVFRDKEMLYMDVTGA